MTVSTESVPVRRLHTLVIGSGAAGLAAAVRLDAAGVAPVAIYTEGLKMGTSINTGSDKQTYYKLGLYGEEPDSPVLLARDLAAGGSVHGDIALAEAALSPVGFSHLAALGVPFPHDAWGQYIGYRTDHDPRRRATSCGPYTSRDMCLALTSEVRRRGIEVRERRIAVELLTIPTPEGGKRCCGAIFLDLDAKAEGAGASETVLADNVVFAVGGPGGLYARSVYPAVHTGAIGLALAAGARARNLAESQFGMAALKFRWNVSGSYMQVLPRFVSRAADGAADEKEFLRPAFPSVAAMYDMIFLKGYQWPFAAGHLPDSSLIDILVDREIARGRRVYLDYRSDPADFDFAALAPETREYLERSGATSETPLRRLEAMNSPALELFRSHGIDLAAEPLEIAVCAQHNNGGLAGDAHWESENVARLFPIGEVNGSHGVTRPGGSALNAGQVGAFRAAEYIAATTAHHPLDEAAARAAAEAALARFAETFARDHAGIDWREERNIFQLRMSAAGAFLREKEAVRKAHRETHEQLLRLEAAGLAGLSTADAAEHLRNRQLLTAQLFYLASIMTQIEHGVGSRGGAAVVAADGVAVHPKLPLRIAPENPRFRSLVLTAEWENPGEMRLVWEKCRPIPASDGWFETVWRDFRTGAVWNEEEPSK